ncbi:MULTISPECIES: ureidoglycolate dehydrogenase [unclassified Facklamia]|uniref:ureidoglycolate dehydrogenase n=1 Tax=Aerococcaceae TaxID=186827 RepID=UPI0013B64329|nr:MULTISPECIES: ureidoglycolate dehydrogenase [unclassified Facklamia]NEW64699.1 ureidoglycolate dehydrogenase [Facklamia sp. 252]NEW68024.1 ureidoglycolate dehydrogenase [Facklamia sp. 253]QQD66524.1 ureidoglycolate dehydrogenase [Aerococcaceae bacterium zg-252]
MNKLLRIEHQELRQLIQNKLMQAGLPEDAALETATHLVYADLSGIHSHGAVRVAYYAERLAKGGVTLNPNITYTKTGPGTAVLDGDNGQGHYIANLAVDKVIELTKENGISMVGVTHVSHTGMLAYYAEKIADAGLVTIVMTQSDPMVVPFGGAENYYGTNPIAFGAPRKNGRPIIFDMATTVQAWGKILDARSKGQSIPDTWAVNSEGNPTTDPHEVSGLLPIAGPKGYGLMMMVDILSGMIFDLPFGNKVSSMYLNLDKGRNLGHVYITVAPEKFTTLEKFTANIETMVSDLHGIKPAKGFDKVYYPGEIAIIKTEQHLKHGIEIPEHIINYLKSDTVHFNEFGHGGAFG